MLSLIIYRLFFYTLLVMGMHPLHLSVMNVDYNAQKNLFEVAVKVFQDDFTGAFEEYYGTKLQLTNDKTGSMEQVKAYFDLHVNFETAKGGKETWEFIRHEQREESFWFYYTVYLKDPGNEINIYHDLFTDRFPDQVNLIIFTSGGKQKGLRFTGAHKNEKVQLYEE